MPKIDNVRKVLVIGSGPVTVGQGCEFVYAVTEAARALTRAGCEVVMANSNPAAEMTDHGISRDAYVDSLLPETVAKIVGRERPDALFAVAGGYSAINLMQCLAADGVLAEHGVRVLGTTPEIVEMVRDRLAFRAFAHDLGVAMPWMRPARDFAAAREIVAETGYPVMVRPVKVRGTIKAGLVFNVEDLERQVVRAVAASPEKAVLIEQPIAGWREIEVEMIFDAGGRGKVLCVIENVDPVGVHSADSISVTPPQGLAADVLAEVVRISELLAGKMKLCGCANFRFALDADTGSLLFCRLTPWASRTSAFASKAAGFSIGRAAALATIGYGLDEIESGGVRLADFSAGDTVAVRFPRWPFDRITGARDRLDTRKRAFGETVAFGVDFPEAFQKAVQSLELGRRGVHDAPEYDDLDADGLLRLLNEPSSERAFVVYAALRKGVAVGKIVEKTGLAEWFVAALSRIGAAPGSATQVSVRSSGRYCYFSHAAGDVRPCDGRKILLVGGGPNRIGQGGEFDYCTFEAVKVLRAAGYSPVVINSNPAAVTLDLEETARAYVEPVTLERVLDVIEYEKPEGVILQFGGRTTQEFAAALKDAGARILGTTAETIFEVDDRLALRERIRKLGIPQPEFAAAGTDEEAFEMAEHIGYPFVIRPVSGDDRRPMSVLHDREMLAEYIRETGRIAPDAPVMIEEFLDNALEAEVDAVADGNDVCVPVVIEHIEFAGIHSADSACVLPPIGVSVRHIETIGEHVRQIAGEFGVIGLLNVQFAVWKNVVIVLDVGLSASRTLPLVNKLTGISLAGVAVRLMLGEKLGALDIARVALPGFGVKNAVFPFDVFPEVDPAVGPLAKSTGAVMGIGESFGLAFDRAQAATKIPLPSVGSILITVAERDWLPAFDVARRFKNIGWKIKATRGTAQYLEEHGIECETVLKTFEGRPNIIDAIRNDEIHLVLNTPADKRSKHDDPDIRKAAIEHGVAYVTTTAAALAAVCGIQARSSGGEISPLQQVHARSLRPD